MLFAARPQFVVHAFEPAPQRLALRPRLPLDGQPTGPDAVLDRTVAAVSAKPLEPLPLDPVSVADDVNYAKMLQTQRNLRLEIKEGLKAFYPI